MGILAYGSNCLPISVIHQRTTFSPLLPFKVPYPNLLFSCPSQNLSPTTSATMPIKTLQASDVPTLDQLHDTPTSSLLPAQVTGISKPGPGPAKFTVIGHRGSGMNSVNSTTRYSSAVKENSILSFNEAGRFPISFVEFDVQVTSDGQPVIFHDNFILNRDKESGVVSEKRVTDLSLQEFLSYSAEPLLRRTHDGEIFDWIVENDDPLCTLEEAFLKVNPNLGFNIELKFDDDIAYKDEHLISTLQPVLQCVFQYSGNRHIIFSTFQPDAARLVRRLQGLYPVFFLTDGGTEIYGDARRNTLAEAVKLCTECGLQGIVSEVRGVLRNPSVISEVKVLGFGLLTYGQLNNVGEVVYLQHLMGVDGVIVDRVREITESVSGFLWRCEGEGDVEGEGISLMRPQFSQRELAFLLKLIPELVRT